MMMLFGIVGMMMITSLFMGGDEDIDLSDDEDEVAEDGDETLGFFDLEPSEDATYGSDYSQTTQTATDDDDIMIGDDTDDTLFGGTGEDEIGGDDGDDLLFGGGGDDHVYGQEGSDALYGDAGNDELHGEDGDDTAQGGAGDDALFGHMGDDTLHGDTGDDALTGGQGNDALYGGDGNDSIMGGYGDDILVGGFGQDSLFGGRGDDQLSGVAAGRPDLDVDEMDFLNGGAGDDTIMMGDGDIVNGGSGADTFMAGHWMDSAAAQVTDFDIAEDEIVVVFDDDMPGDPVVAITPNANSPDTMVITLDGHPVANVANATDLTLDDIELMPKSAAMPFFTAVAP